MPGIDVPFHSSELHAGVEDFRARLDDLLPETIDPSVLVGRYIPNLVPRMFTLDREFVEEVASYVDSPLLTPVLEDWAAWEADPARLGRTLLIELLAWQFASPVRWIETQDLLFGAPEHGGLGIEQFVEVGVASAPTLANLAAQTTKLPSYDGVAPKIVNSARDEAVVFATDTPMADDEPEEVEDDDPGGRARSPDPSRDHEAEPPAAKTAAAGAERPADLTYTAADATKTLAALRTKVRPDQIGTADTIEALCDGVSSRRNQLLVDLGAELSLGAIDGAAEAEWKALSANVDKLARTYKPFGPVLTEAVQEQLRKFAGAAGSKPAAIVDRVKDTWQLGPGWVSHVQAELAAGLRDGSSTRGGDLGFGIDLKDLPSVVDHAVQAVGKAQGVQVDLPATGGGDGAMVDSAALDEFTASVTGKDGVLASTARHLLGQLGLTEPVAEESEDLDAELVQLVESELGSDWARKVAPSFDERRAVLLDDRWASVREDFARVWVGDEEAREHSFVGLDDAAKAQAGWWLDRARREKRDDLIPFYDGAISRRRRHQAVERRGGRGHRRRARLDRRRRRRGPAPRRCDRRRDHVTAGPGAARVLPRPLPGPRLDRCRPLGAAGQPGVLHRRRRSRRVDLRPRGGDGRRAEDRAASGPRADAGLPVRRSPGAGHGGRRRLARRGGVPDPAVGCRAPGHGSRGPGRRPPDRAPRARRAARLAQPRPLRRRRGVRRGQGRVRRLRDALARREGVGAACVAGPRPHRLGPRHRPDGSQRPAGRRRHRGRRPHLVAAGDGRRAARPVQPGAARGRRRVADRHRPDRWAGRGRPRPRRARSGSPGAGREPATERRSSLSKPTTTHCSALTHPAGWGVEQPTMDWPSIKAKPEDLVVIVGAGEVGPVGSARTRFEMEVEDHLSPAGVLELAWTTGLIVWEQQPVAGWHDVESGEPLTEAEIVEKYAEQIEGNVGIRRYRDDGDMVDNTAPLVVPVFLEEDTSFVVRTKDEADAFAEADPKKTRIAPTEDGDWLVTRLAGSQIRVPRRFKLSRFVGAQVPDGFDPKVWGLGSMTESVDRLAAWNLVATVDAFISSGFEPAELLRWIHPTKFANTQGTGIGGMQSTRKMYVDALLGEQPPNDVLQEALPNVIAAHTVQAYLGGYGAMVHPVAACATAAVSVEEGVDKIRLDKASVVVAGGFDDLGIEGILGFGNMSATADTAEMLAKGIDEKHVCRPNDRRRGGFVEGQGGGTVVLARGDVAVEMGLPVLGVIAYAGSFADGIHTSIPAPGMGALGAGIGGTDVAARSRAGLGRPRGRRPGRGVEARHLDRGQRPQRVDAAREARRVARPYGGQPAVRGEPEVADRSRQGRRRRLPAERALPDAGERHAPPEPRPGLRRRGPRRERAPGLAAPVAGDRTVPGRRTHQPRLRPRERDGRGSPPGRLRGLAVEVAEGRLARQGNRATGGRRDPSTGRHDRRSPALREGREAPLRELGAGRHQGRRDSDARRPGGQARRQRRLRPGRQGDRRTTTEDSTVPAVEEVAQQPSRNPGTQPADASNAGRARTRSSEDATSSRSSPRRTEQPSRRARSTSKRSRRRHRRSRHHRLRRAASRTRHPVRPRVHPR